ncbi:MAG: acetyl-CoA acetyltransferase [Paenibacillus dendritiformis]|uniref:acetyl-CoA acetyltransferase n=1 Tax=uncultured Paenibacillus sp. TaxID=227322 RepID=UPI0025E15935|nr:acetyl-CoA acetyltransferase [uncultured Paenibacillus sp.]MDU5144921.1 acetyl-CoA acetyltransferase [Paenibacillus dendritiformis]
MHQPYSAHHCPYPQQHQVIYQMEPGTVQALYSLRDRVKHMGRMYKDRHVRVQTIDGQVYEGIIVNVDRCHLYLYTRMLTDQRALGGAYYNNVILPLVLYELLVITLLST